MARKNLLTNSTYSVEVVSMASMYSLCGNRIRCIANDAQALAMNVHDAMLR